MEDITVKELKERLDRGDKIVLIDVREPYEREEFSIGGQLIPMGNFPVVIPELNEFKDQEIVVYCRSGRRSGVIKKMLVGHGFARTRNLDGGMLAWLDAFGE